MIKEDRIVEYRSQTTTFNWNLVKGLGAIFIASLFFSASQALTKEVYNTSNISPWEIVYWRSLILFFFNILVVRHHGETVLWIPQKHVLTMSLRVLTGVLSTLLIFLQTKVLSVSKAVSLFFTYPTFTMLFAYFMLSEKVTKFDSLGCLLSFVGALLVVLDSAEDKNTDNAWWAPIVPIGSAVVVGLTNVYARKLGTDVNYAVAPALFGLFNGLVAPILAGMSVLKSNELPLYGSREIFIILLIGCTETLGQTLAAKAYQIEKAGRVAVVAYFQVVNACIVDLTIFKIEIGALEYIGVIAIVGSNVVIMVLKGCGVIL